MSDIPRIPPLRMTDDDPTVSEAAILSGGGNSQRFGYPSRLGDDYLPILEPFVTPQHAANARPAGLASVSTRPAAIPPNSADILTEMLATRLDLSRDDVPSDTLANMPATKLNISRDGGPSKLAQTRACELEETLETTTSAMASTSRALESLTEVELALESVSSTMEESIRALERLMLGGFEPNIVFQR
ncbi:hypothetical protein CC80DRAFT_541428 [Byssothecium circinans]|uniref:Uncharacterized protein n=1 Tax=Byssothecium circinans TaxID=147558 RepID=A0A6A5UFU5_9PLEO|nr:hypothetical protein CC80DRAFT_541428 [Byssothecium circinans]